MLTEVKHYLNMIEDLRRQVGELVADLPAQALNWRPMEGEDDHATNSLAVMAAHVAGAEHFWVAEVVGQRPPTRVRADEFKTQAEGPGELLERLSAVGKETREVLASLDEATLGATRDIEGNILPVRWAILHVIDHTALHLGHMQLTRQLWQGGQAAGGPRWFQRVDVDG